MKEKEEDIDNIDKHINNYQNIITITKKSEKKQPRPGPTRKKQKINKTEDIELQLALENSDERRERLEKERQEKLKKKQKELEQKLKNKNIIYRIDEENYHCVDCNKEKATYISINNGITLCENCAKQHKKLTNSVSYIISINAKMDEYLLNFVVFGSNTKFKRFLKSEKINENLEMFKKYKTKAIYYYRKRLKNKIQKIDEPYKDYIDSNEIVENFKNDFPEFNNYKMNKVVIENGELKKDIFLISLLGKIFNFGKKDTKMEKYKHELRSTTTSESLKKDNSNDSGDREIYDNDINIKNLHKKKIQYNNMKDKQILVLKESSRPLEHKDNNNIENE